MRHAKSPTIRDIVFPAYDLGQCLTLLIFALICVIVWYDNIPLLMYILGGGYVGASLLNVFLGLYPTSAYAPAKNLGNIRQALSSAPGLAEIGIDMWAPKRYKSIVWQSSRISVQQEGEKVLLIGRARDIKAIKLI